MARQAGNLPLKSQQVRLRVDWAEGAHIRWLQIVPDVSTLYNNANDPWHREPYKWVGFARIACNKRELDALRDHWEVDAHIGVLARDANGNGLLDAYDLVLHSGPFPLQYAPLGGQGFDGHVLVLRAPP